MENLFQYRNLRRNSLSALRPITWKTWNHSMDNTDLLIRFTKSLLAECDTRVKRLAISDALHRAASLNPEAQLLVDAAEMQPVFRDIYGSANPFPDEGPKGLEKW